MAQDLCTAINQRNIKLMKCLILDGTDVNQCVENDGIVAPPITHAINMEQCHLLSAERTTPGAPVQQMSSVLSLLLSHPCLDVNVTEQEKGYTALHAAVINALPTTVKVLIDMGADINTQCKRTLYAPLHCASRHDCIETVTVLLNNGAHVDCQDYLLRTPLYHAVANSELPIIELLMKRGASLNVMDCETGRTLLHEAAGRDPVITEVLLRAGARMVFDYFNFMPLHEAFKWSNFGCVAELVRHGVDIRVLLTAFPKKTVMGVVLKKVLGLCLVGRCDEMFWQEVNKLVLVILAAGYKLYQDSWLAAQQPCLGSHPEYIQLVQTLQEERTKCRTLKQLSRQNLRQYLRQVLDGQSIIPSIQSLELPDTLKDYLEMKSLKYSSKLD